MKAVAAALVVIAGAAIVLWYGNTLNSWVLGGLIGGLAALLLSIPISLTLFSFLSRRHDERFHAELQDQDELALARFHAAPAFPERYVQEVYEEEYAYSDEEEWDEEEERYRRHLEQRYLPEPPASRLPAADRESLARRLPAPQSPPSSRSAYAPSPASQSAQRAARNKDVSRRRAAPQPAPRGQAPGVPGSQVGSRSQYQSQALRAARREAAQQYDNNDEYAEPPTTVSRRQASMRPSRHYADEYFEEQPPATTARRLPPTRASQPFIDEDALASHQSPESTRARYPRRPRRNLDMQPPQNSRRRSSAPLDDESTTERYEQAADPQTDYLDLDVATEDLRRPLQRRAPYMYDNDELRQELAQHMDAPVTRRSSRYLNRPYDDE